MNLSFEAHAEQTGTVDYQINYRLKDFETGDSSAAESYFTNNAKVSVTQDRYIVTLFLTPAGTETDLIINGQQFKPQSEELSVTFLVQNLGVPLEGKITKKTAENKQETEHFLIVFDTADLPQSLSAAESSASAVPAEVSSLSSTMYYYSTSTETQSSPPTPLKQAVTSSLWKQENAISKHFSQNSIPQTFAVKVISTDITTLPPVNGIVKTETFSSSVSTENRPQNHETDNKDNNNSKQLVLVAAVVLGLGIGFRTLLANNRSV
ncbi:hypothetical protein [Liquorilactobacillus oeni]|uniref:NEAT domain-containing protein n=1 Tax=Liquorilactobacillus oeni DSM 19972 TaxID=1423777 RepID=A0A0R1MC70_9LACO|nr:hypothetical protein [Liquorilactobacillus oeni]KRL05433.1 hypothetical protein FD46_GL000846 [Liquorilactobacillus oeni DSM 19972]